MSIRDWFDLVLAAVVVCSIVLMLRQKYESRKSVWLIFGGRQRNHILGMYSTEEKAHEYFRWWIALTGYAEGMYLIEEQVLDDPIPPRDEWEAIKERDRQTRKL